MATAYRSHSTSSRSTSIVRTIIAWLAIAAIMLSSGTYESQDSTSDADPSVQTTCSWSRNQECIFDGTYVIDSSGSHYKVLTTTLTNIPDAAIAWNLTNRSGLSTFVKSNPWYTPSPYDITTCNKSGCTKAKYATGKDGVIYLLESSPSTGDAREV